MASLAASERRKSVRADEHKFCEKIALNAMSEREYGREITHSDVR